MRTYLSNSKAAQSASKRKHTRPLKDKPTPGDGTLFTGTGTHCRESAGGNNLDILNALGFFLYTQCRDNERGDWPLCTCASPSRTCAMPSCAVHYPPTANFCLCRRDRHPCSARLRPFPSAVAALNQPTALGLLYKCQVFKKANLYGDEAQFVSSTMSGTAQAKQ